jgi:hypothetical protein
MKLRTLFVSAALALPLASIATGVDADPSPTGAVRRETSACVGAGSLMRLSETTFMANRPPRGRVLTSAQTAGMRDALRVADNAARGAATCHGPHRELYQAEAYEALFAARFYLRDAGWRADAEHAEALLRSCASSDSREAQPGCQQLAARVARVIRDFDKAEASGL